MGRGRVQLKRIENKISRQVTFSKRRSGLQKKVSEISILCDADVGLIIFSTKGKLFEFSPDSSMETIIEKYEQYIYPEKRIGNDSERKENWRHEYSKLRARIELLQRNIRNYGGQDLDPLSLRELQNLEQQIESALKRIRTVMNQLMNESVSQLQKKERSLQEQNSLISKQTKENEKKKQEEEGSATNAFLLPKSPSQLHIIPSLTTICSQQQQQTTTRDDEDPRQTLPAWLLKHKNQY